MRFVAQDSYAPAGAEHTGCHVSSPPGLGYSLTGVRPFASIQRRFRQVGVHFASLKARIGAVRSCGETFVAMAPRHVNHDVIAVLYDLISASGAGFADLSRGSCRARSIVASATVNAEMSDLEALQDLPCRNGIRCSKIHHSEARLNLSPIPMAFRSA